MKERIGMCDTLDKLSLERKTEESSGKWASSNKVLVARDVEGHKFVVIPQVIFKGKRSISWKEVEKYLIRYIGDIFQVLRLPIPKMGFAPCYENKTRSKKLNLDNKCFQQL